MEIEGTHFGTPFGVAFGLGLELQDTAPLYLIHLPGGSAQQPSGSQPAAFFSHLISA